MSKQVFTERTMSIRAYLEKTNHREAIKKMMMSLYPKISKTEKEWEIEDKKINTRRC